MAKATAKKKPYEVPYPMMEIVWDDASSHSETWVHLNTLEGALEPVRTLGYLVKETRKAYTIVGSVPNEDLVEDDLTVGNTMIIPKGMVVSARVVSLATVREVKSASPKKRKRAPKAEQPAMGETSPLGDGGH